jgi:hypothetical protein
MGLAPCRPAFRLAQSEWSGKGKGANPSNVGRSPTSRIIDVGIHVVTPDCCKRRQTRDHQPQSNLERTRSSSERADTGEIESLQYDVKRDLASSEVRRLPTLVTIVNTHKAADACTILCQLSAILAGTDVCLQCSTDLHQIDPVHLLCCKTQTRD